MSLLMALPADVPFNPHHQPEMLQTYTSHNEHRVGEDTPPKKKRRKVNHACLYCRRSHMVCSEQRPCQRCIKREIAHLCRDEAKPTARKPSTESTTSIQDLPSKAPAAFSTATNPNTPVQQQPFLIQTHQLQQSISPQWSQVATQDPRSSSVTPAHSIPYQSDPSANGNFSALGTANFLDGLDDRSFFAAQQAALISSTAPSATNLPQLPSTISPTPFFPESAQPQTHPHAQLSQQPNTIPHATNPFEVPVIVPPGSLVASSASSISSSRPQSTSLPDHSLPHPALHHRHSSASITSFSGHSHSPSSSSLSRPATASLQLTGPEHFIWTAASQQSPVTGNKDEALANVIRSKYEAGLLVPFDYDQGYARLAQWMDTNVSLETKQQITDTIATLRPKCQAISQTLSNVEHICIEEQFERLLYDYDRVFSAMGVPACLWRPTGDLYKANREFAQLIGIEVDELVNGRAAIYELMSEDSTLNFWEKYAQVALDAGQKAVLTSCVLKFAPSTPQPQQQQPGAENGLGLSRTYINCCFSFTIRRDPWGVPIAIIGNFIPY